MRRDQSVWGVWNCGLSQPQPLNFRFARQPLGVFKCQRAGRAFIRPNSAMHSLAHAPSALPSRNQQANVGTTSNRQQCATGHRWNAALESIKKGSWCPECAGVRRLTLEEMQRLAESRGARCLSRCYLKAASKLIWQCSANHRWSVSRDGQPQ